MTTTDPESILEDIADEFTASLRAGRHPRIESYAERHPTLAEDIHEMLSSIELMEQLSRNEADSRKQANECRVQTPAIEKLGDFDIVREIGRGGMGIVYEAVDRTLQRRVALKVLNDSALTTQKHIDRFRRESRLAAQLHHTNIVSVFGVGEEDGKHFYAMQYVEGVTVQDILDGLKRLPSPNAGHNFSFDPQNTSDGLVTAAALRDGQFAKSRSTHDCVKQFSATKSNDSAQGALTLKSLSNSDPTINSPFDDSPSSQASSQTVELSNSTRDDSRAGRTVENDASWNVDITCDSLEFEKEKGPKRKQKNAHDSTFGQPYWQSVARIGLQVADALHYAHVSGILHRDIKPANLLFDPNGTIWVADFGLAKLSETDDLTNTGDAVGTLKYMAPEQLAGSADARTDIYALGLTLYELLTLQPVCDGETYKSLFAQKQSPAHMAPRKINPTIPRDLETIVQKTLEWEQDRRYASSRELSEDLQRFLDDVPIRARQVTLAERTWRWCRRNRALASLGAMVACLFVSLPIVLGWAYVRESRQNTRMENTLVVVLDGFDELFGSYLDDDVATASALIGASRDETPKLAPAMLSKDTATVLEKMLKVYDRLATENASSVNVDLAVESAKARRRVGDLYQQLGQFGKARDAYEDAASRYSKLSIRNATHHTDVARVYQAIGTIHEQRQDFDLARQEYEKAILSLKQAPLSGESQFELAQAHYLLGKRQIIEGEAPKPRLARNPRPLVGRHEFDNSTHTAEEERLIHIDAAIDLVNQLRAEDSSNAAYRFLLALCLREQERGGQLNSSSEVNATGLLKDLAEEFPHVPRYRYELCETYRIYGRFVLEGREGERLEKLQLARELAEQLVKEQRDSAPYRINLAHIYAYLGIEYDRFGDFKQMEKFTRLSIATHESVTEDFPGLATLSSRLSMNDKIRLGGRLLQLRRYEELVELLQPLGDQLYQQLDAARVSENDLPKASRMILNECRALLLLAYESLGDNVGYLVALGWSDQANAGGQNRPHIGPPAGWTASVDPVAMAWSYDSNHDQLITRDEVPTRMALEWFRRVDVDDNDEIDRAELASHLSR